MNQSLYALTNIIPPPLIQTLIEEEFEKLLTTGLSYQIKFVKNKPILSNYLDWIKQMNYTHFDHEVPNLNEWWDGYTTNILHLNKTFSFSKFYDKEIQTVYLGDQIVAIANYSYLSSIKVEPIVPYDPAKQEEYRLHVKIVATDIQKELIKKEIEKASSESILVDFINKKKDHKIDPKFINANYHFKNMKRISDLYPNIEMNNLKQDYSISRVPSFGLETFEEIYSLFNSNLFFSDKIDLDVFKELKEYCESFGFKKRFDSRMVQINKGLIVTDV